MRNEDGNEQSIEQLAQRFWQAATEASTVAGRAMTVHLAMAQLLRTSSAVVLTNAVSKPLANLAVGLLGEPGRQLLVRNLYRTAANPLHRQLAGAAAKSASTKIVANAITGNGLVTALISVPSVYHYARGCIAGECSTGQFVREVGGTAASVYASSTGGTVGAAMGATVGSVIPVFGTAVGGFVGGIAGSIVAGSAASWVFAPRSTADSDAADASDAADSEIEPLTNAILVAAFDRVPEEEYTGWAACLADAGLVDAVVADIHKLRDLREHRFKLFSVYMPVKIKNVVKECNDILGPLESMSFPFSGLPA